MDGPLLELNAVSWRQRETQILSDVSWAIRPRERWAILGPNGSGKSSLLKIACGHQWPSDGVVRRLGRELIDLSELRRSIGWVSSELVRAIPPHEPALDTVVSGPLGQLGLKRFGHVKIPEAAFEYARHVLADLHCAHLADRPFGVLSQGEKQQVLVARARAGSPMLVVCDEPCAGMDPGVRERFLAWVASVTESPDGPAWVFVTHHVEEILPTFDHTMLLSGGRVHASGATADVLTVEHLQAIYGVRIDQLEERDGRRWIVGCSTS